MRARVATAAILGARGQCHRAMQVRPIPSLDTDIKVGGLVGHMLLHQHGSDAFMEGLVARPTRPGLKGCGRRPRRLSTWSTRQAERR